MNKPQMIEVFQPDTDIPDDGVEYTWTYTLRADGLYRDSNWDDEEEGNTLREMRRMYEIKEER